MQATRWSEAEEMSKGEGYAFQAKLLIEADTFEEALALLAAHFAALVKDPDAKQDRFCGEMLLCPFRTAPTIMPPSETRQ